MIHRTLLCAATLTFMGCQATIADDSDSPTDAPLPDTREMRCSDVNPDPGDLEARLEELGWFGSRPDSAWAERCPSREQVNVFLDYGTSPHFEMRVDTFSYTGERVGTVELGHWCAGEIQGCPFGEGERVEPPEHPVTGESR